MRIWTVETDGRALIVYAAETRAAAEDAINPDGAIAADLSVLTYPDGGPLWNGDQNLLLLRETEAEEQAMWDNTVARAVLDGELDSREQAMEDCYVVFLVPAVDPREDDLNQVD